MIQHGVESEERRCSAIGFAGRISEGFVVQEIGLALWLLHSRVRLQHLQKLVCRDL